MFAILLKGVTGNVWWLNWKCSIVEFFKELFETYKMFYMSQMNPKQIFHNTKFSLQLPYIAGHSL